MAHSGFVKLHRSVLDCDWYSNLNMRVMFIHLLLIADWEDCTYTDGREIKRGQCRITMPRLRAECGLTEKQSRTALDKLVKAGVVAVERCPRYSVITILGYDEYQRRGSTSVSKRAVRGQPNGQAEDSQTGSATIYKENKNTRSEEDNGTLRQLLDMAVCEYNSVCVSLEPMRGELSYHQAQLIRQAAKELHGVTFREYFTRVERSAFLTGKTGSFKAAFDWLIRPENIAKVLTGKYDVSYQTTGKETKERDYNAPLW